MDEDTLYRELDEMDDSAILVLMHRLESEAEQDATLNGKIKLIQRYLSCRAFDDEGWEGYV